MFTVTIQVELKNYFCIGYADCCINCSNSILYSHILNNLNNDDFVFFLMYLVSVYKYLKFKYHIPTVSIVGIWYHDTLNISILCQHSIAIQIFKYLNYPWLLTSIYGDNILNYCALKSCVLLIYEHSLAMT
jgi:hypothetical protein